MKKLKIQGVALISVLFLLSLCVIIIASLISNISDSIDREINYINSEQALLLCFSGEELAISYLNDDIKNSASSDSLYESWSTSNIHVDTYNGYFEVDIQDAQGKFNINNVIKSGERDQELLLAFSRFLNNIYGDDDLSSIIAEEWADWIDQDSVNGTEEFDYQDSLPNYRPPNFQVLDVSELRLLKSMTPDFFRQLMEYSDDNLIALPGQTKINVNTVTPQTLASLADITLKEASSILNTLRSNASGLSDSSPLLQLLPPAKRAALAPYMTVRSDYFQVRTRARVGDTYAYLTTILHRSSTNSGGIEVVSRDRSEKFVFPHSVDYRSIKARSSDREIDI